MGKLLRGDEAAVHACAPIYVPRRSKFIGCYKVCSARRNAASRNARIYRERSVTPRSHRMYRMCRGGAFGIAKGINSMRQRSRGKSQSQDVGFLRHLEFKLRFCFFFLLPNLLQTVVTSICYSLQFWINDNITRFVNIFYITYFYLNTRSFLLQRTRPIRQEILQ